MSAHQGEKVFFLINIRSGGRRAAEALRNLQEYATTQSNCVEVEELDFGRLPAQVAKASAADILVLGGGDGTISRLVGLLLAHGGKIGILPLGTGNDLARELSIVGQVEGASPSRLIDFYRTAATRRVTVFNLEYGENLSSSTQFINYASFGFDAKVVCDFARLRERNIWRLFRGVWANRIGYVGLGLRHLGYRFDRNFTIKSIEGQFTFAKAKSVIFSNIRSMMGMGISNSRSLPFDERLECIVVTHVFNYLMMLSHLRFPLFYPSLLGSSSTWELCGVEGDVPVQVDGEPRPDIISDHYRISPKGSIAMIVGSNCP